MTCFTIKTKLILNFFSELFSLKSRGVDSRLKETAKQKRELICVTLKMSVALTIYCFDPDKTLQNTSKKSKTKTKQQQSILISKRLRRATVKLLSGNSDDLDFCF